MARIAALLAILCAVAAGPARANGAPAGGWQEIDADALVEACWAISHEDRASGSSLRMSEGAATTLECLREEIIRQAEAFLDPRHTDMAEIREMLVSRALLEHIQPAPGVRSILRDAASDGTGWRDCGPVRRDPERHRRAAERLSEVARSAGID